MNKPHLYKGSVSHTWYCLDGRWLGWGATPEHAYVAWRLRDPERSWVHARATALQRRRGVPVSP